VSAQFVSRFEFDDHESRSFRRMRQNSLVLGFDDVDATMLAAYAAGRSARTVAYAMERGESTIRAHIKAAYERLGVNDQAHLAIRLMMPPRRSSIR
jgi:DNA-binding NarL/FixJ family response regulator